MRLFLFFIAFAGFLSADAVIHISNKQKYDYFPLQYYTDDNSSLSIHEIEDVEFQEGTSNFTLGYKKETALWFKISVTNQTSEKNFILSVGEGFYEVADLYYKEAEQDSWKQKKNSVFLPLDQRDVKSGDLSFNLTINPHETKTVYLQLKGRYAYFGNISLYPQNDYIHNYLVGKNMLFIYSFGVLSIIIIFSLFLFARMKERIYGYYLGYSFFNLLYMFIISGSLLYINLSEHLYKVNFVASLALAFLLLFSFEYMNIKNYFKKSYKLFYTLPLLIAIPGVLTLFWFQPWNKIVSTGLLLILVFLLIAAIRIYSLGHKNTRYYILALVFYFGSLIIYLLMIKGMIEYTFWTRYIMFVASPVEITIFTLMLADRHYEMKEQKIAIQDQLIEEKNLNQKRLENEVSKQTEKLKVLLQERELLLREVNHRVKNNFHLLSGMLWLKDKKANQNNHTELINRIQSLSKLHEKLYSSSDLHSISTRDYLEDIIQNIQIAYKQKNFTLSHSIADLKIDFDQATALGIILNELLTNSYIHNSDVREMRVMIQLHKKDNDIEFTYQDSGRGFDIEGEYKGLGLKIIEQFSDKLSKDGAHFSSAKGVSFTLIFPQEQKAYA